MTKQAKISIALLFVLLALGTALLFTQIGVLPNPPALTPTSIPSASPPPEPKPVNIEAKVTPWGSMYRTEPDCKEDFSVELVYPNQNENFTTDTFNVTFNAGAFYWVIEKAYYTSDLFSGQRWINVSKNQYAQDLQKTFSFNLINVPAGPHYLTLTVIFHEGTKNNATALFKVSA